MKIQLSSSAAGESSENVSAAVHEYIGTYYVYFRERERERLHAVDLELLALGKKKTWLLSISSFAIRLQENAPVNSFGRHFQTGFISKCQDTPSK